MKYIRAAILLSLAVSLGAPVLGCGGGGSSNGGRAPPGGGGGSVGGGGGSGGTAPAGPTATPRGTITAGASLPLAAQPVPAAGGTIKITKPGDPLDGLTVEVPSGAYKDQRPFQISAAPVSGHTFGPDFNPLTPLITVRNGGGYADKPMKMTIPARVPPGHFAMAFLYDEASGTVEGMPILESTADHVTVFTMNFEHSAQMRRLRGAAPRVIGAPSALALETESESKIVMSSLPQSALIGMYSTNFRPGVDDWPFTNYGSYASPMGNCDGMSFSAIWYYTAQKLMKGAEPLFTRFDNDGRRRTPTLWQDDAAGIRYVSMVQDSFGPTLLDLVQLLGQTVSKDSVTLNAFAYALKLTGEPQEVYIYHRREGRTQYDGHAMVVTSLFGDDLRISDPNYPGKTDRRIHFNRTNEAFDPYPSGTNARSLGTLYPTIFYVGRTSIFSFSRPEDFWPQVVDGTIGKGKFPEYSLHTLDADVNVVPLVDGFKATEGRLSVIVRTMGFREIWEVYDEQGRKLQKEGTTAVEVAPGRNLYGISIADQDNNWVGFNWLTIEGPTTTGQLRIKVIATFSEDPNDNIADPLSDVEVQIGPSTAQVPVDDNTARTTISPGTHVIKFPKANGLDDEDGQPLYRVGSINVNATGGSGSGQRCAPTSQEGDVSFTFQATAANPASQSDYEVAIRIVPFDAPALRNGVTCR